MADLTQTQIKQLLNYCESVEREGWYYGHQYQFIARHNAIVKWLLEKLK